MCRSAPVDVQAVSDALTENKHAHTAAQLKKYVQKRGHAPVDVQAVSDALTAAVPAQVVVLAVPAAAETSKQQLAYAQAQV
jgi:hypothetical protein